MLEGPIEPNLNLPQSETESSVLTPEELFNELKHASINLKNGRFQDIWI